MDSAAEASEAGAWTLRLRKVRTRTWLLLATAAYFVVAFGLSVLRYFEVRASNWDLGIWMQALWSTGQGRALYEAGDYETFGATTILQTHPALVLFGIAPVYDALPTPLLLFALQAAAVALAAVPLYLIARRIGATGKRALLASGLYLLWAPLLSANLYDIHLEAFLPLELLLVFLCWLEGRYAVGGAVAFVAFLTIEVTPILIFAIGAYFLLPPLRRTLYRAVALWDASAPETRWRKLWAAAILATRRGLQTPRARASLALMVSALVAYYALRYLQFNAPSLFQGTSSAAVSTDVGLTPQSLGISPWNVAGAFPEKLTYWLILFATIGFLPLRAPRTLLLVLPWMFFTFTAVPTNTYVTLGLQYSFVAAAPLMVGVAYGLRDLDLPSVPAAWNAFLRSGIPPGEVTAGSLSRGGLGTSRPRPSPSTGRRAAWTLALVGVIALNLVLSPADPLVQNSSLANGYQWNYNPSQGFAQIQQLCALLPAGATIMATDDLFPFVANDVNAYSFLWYNAAPQVLPFNATTLPPYALVSAERFTTVPDWFAPLLFNSSFYGVRGAVGNTHAGVVYLFQEHYVGPPLLLRTLSGVTTKFPTTSLTATSDGTIREVPGPGSPDQIEGKLGSAGPMWTGPVKILPQGSYTITFSLRAWWGATPGFPTPPNPTSPVLRLNATGLGVPRPDSTEVEWGNFSATGWTNVTLSMSLAYPALAVQFPGWQLQPDVVPELSLITLTPDPA